MFCNSEIEESLIAMGARVRKLRLAKGDSQAVFAMRLGVSVPTLRELEQGSPAVGIGVFVAALWALSRLADLDSILASQESLFAQLKRQPRERKRSPRRSKAKATISSAR